MMNNTGSGQLRMQGVRVVAGGRPIVSDVSCVIEQGEFVTLIGPNGAGKTTLLKCIAGIMPCSGDILLGDKDLSTMNSRARARLIGYVPQVVPPAPYTVREFVTLGRYPHLSHFRDFNHHDLEIIDEALRMTECEDLAMQPLLTLSGGETRRAAMAAALAQQPKLLLLDEPAAFLDPRHRLEFMRLLQKLHKEQGLTVLMVTHHLEHLGSFDETVLGMNHGRLHYHGSVEKLLQGHLLKDIFDTDFTVVTHPQTGRRVPLIEEL